ncbi:hypothetical protein C8R48DRAFT_675727 [Suillus tomentosus]|nr:hypothetical protein C8R48DRAFT_675727 [Suillus tomentosus]
MLNEVLVKATYPAICGKVDDLWKHTSECDHAPPQTRNWAKAEIQKRQTSATANTHLRVSIPSGMPSNRSLTPTVLLQHDSRTPSLPIISLPPSATPTIGSSTPRLLSPLVTIHSLPGEPFYGETVPSQPWPSSQQAEFAADLCCLLLTSNVAWWTVDQPYWRQFFSKWIPQCLMPGSKQLSGRILDEEAERVVDGMKAKVQDHYATGQCDGWKNITKSSIVASTINVEYTPYLLNTCDVSAKPKTAENLLKIVLSEIQYANEVLKVKVVA